MKLTRAVSVLNTLVLRGFGSGVAVVFTVLVSRYLDTESAANFFLLLNLSTIAAICFRWGLDEVIIRQVAKLPVEDMRGEVSKLSVLAHKRVAKWFAVGLFVVIGMGQVGFLKNALSVSLPDIIVALMSAALVALTACVARVLQGNGQTNMATLLLNIIVPGLSLLGFLVLVRLNYRLGHDLIFLYFLVAALVYCGCIYFFRFSPLSLASKFREPSSLGLTAHAANKLGFVVLAQQVLGWVALLVVPYVYGGEVYKSFVVLLKISTLISLIMLAVNFTFSRRFAALYAEREFADIRLLVLYSLTAIVIAAVGFIAVLCFIRGLLFDYAQISSELTALLLVLLIGQLFFSISALFSMVLSMAHDDNYLLIAQALINGIGSLLFVLMSVWMPIEIVSGVMVLSYSALSVVLGMRVFRITRFSEVIR